ncbi:hypothetical protein VC0101557_08560 [Vibrio cholerae VC0101557]|uniref:Uncharacterized protein n=3 Tax=Vibrio cholerae TaxID=666 RepID=A0A0E4GIM5_VIBCL|nr:hypothetical protein VC0395_A2752 [Vibrio cholerae O395]AET28188.1 conserved hypothetical protein [Vibrio cholerae O1 str. 2010EL-1786]APF47950.1 hypothetical protein ASZ80_00366 [Vibrio cholerae]EEO11919.1 hypothetical protein VCC_000064 [Vibrio cholerae RC9]EEO19231.1 hypothetical protein VCE_000073 [Vibrio cholerae B33]EET25771.1 conserved hypothetical protein [Vibrio cholerae MO10]EGR05097.1 hypothetical protein VCHCUF01_0405 [Vibrio cholerae HCUF01]EHH86573.1 hypothetical protein VCH
MKHHLSESFIARQLNNIAPMYQIFSFQAAESVPADYGFRLLWRLH